MTSGSASRRAKERQDVLDQVRADQARHARRRRIAQVSVLSVVVVAAIALIVAALQSARPAQSAEFRVAPDFTLADSDGGSVTLSALRGHPVLLYFSEGAGCDSCIVQMQKIEEEPGFAADGITVLPIVMDKAADINHAREIVGVKAPFLLDDGTVSEEYGTLGTGMHAGLSGHGFVLVDAEGNQVWKGDYPSMWIAPADLLKLVQEKL